MFLVLSCYSQDDPDQLIQAKCHFSRADVDGQIYYLEDDAHVKVKCKLTINLHYSGPFIVLIYSLQ